MTPTIYDIKYDMQEKSPYYFSGKTLKFFGQTMKSFKVRKSPQGRTFVFAPIYNEKKLVGYSFKEYKEHDLISVRYDNGDFFHKTTSLFDIEEFIENH